jgi:hypothetical protein
MFAAGCAKPVPLAGHEDMSMATGLKHDLGGVDLHGADLALNQGNCDTGSHECNGSCIPDTDCCTGMDCPQYANQTAMCAAGMCMYMCNSGFKSCNGDCRSMNLCCADADCPTVANAMTMHCSTTGMCSIAACKPGFYDINHMEADGCECMDLGKAQDCAKATSVGPIAIGGSQMVTGNLPDTMLSNWFSVTFAGNTMGGYHPHVVLSGNPNNEFFMDVVADCTEAPQACGTEAAKTANTVTDWDVKQTGGDPGSKMYAASPPVGVNGVVKVHVYRAPAAAVSCDSYTLTISN